MLSLSIQSEGKEINFDGLADRNCKEIEGIPNSKEILAFVDACIIGTDPEQLTAARDALAAATTPEHMVDACGIVASFQRFGRLADSSGIPLEWLDEEDPEGVRDMSFEINEKMGLNDFESAANPKVRENY